MEVGIPKECVTTHLPNGLALKMDVAKRPADTSLLVLAMD